MRDTILQLNQWAWLAIFRPIILWLIKLTCCVYRELVQWRVQRAWHRIILLWLSEVANGLVGRLRRLIFGENHLWVGVQGGLLCCSWLVKLTNAILGLRFVLDWRASQVDGGRRRTPRILVICIPVNSCCRRGHSGLWWCHHVFIITINFLWVMFCRL